MCYCGCQAENINGSCTLSRNFLCDEDYEETEREEPEEYIETEADEERALNNYEKQFD